MALAKHKKDIVAVLDIGTTKIACFIAQVEANGEAVIKGIGHQVSTGARCGVITDINAAETSILNAVHAAEQMAGERIDEVYVNLSGGQIKSHNLHFTLPLSGHAVSRRDVARLVEYGKSSLRSADREVVHCIPISFSIDEARGIRDPQGMYGNVLGADLHIITAPVSTLKNLQLCVARAQLDVSEFLVSPYASGLACLTEDEMQLGVTLIDIGGGTTSVAVFIDGQPVFTEQVSVGASHVTSDIARGLSCSLTTAERVKALYGSVYASLSDAHEVIDIPHIGTHGEESGESNPVPRSMLSGIIRPRMEEILEMVRGRLEEQGFDRIAGRRVALTGGGSQLMGVSELAAQIFNKQVRIARPKTLRGMADATGGNAFATAIGMMEYAARGVRFQRQHLDLSVAPGVNPMSRAWQWIKEKL